MHTKLSSCFLVFIVAIAAGCVPKIEEFIVGKYRLSSYRLSDTTDLRSVEGQIDLRRNQTFVLELDGKIIKGKWRGKEVDEFAGVTLMFDNKEVTGPLMGHSYSEFGFFQPNYPFDALYEKLVFTKY